MAFTEISTAAELDAIRTNSTTRDGDYVLVNDIDLTYDTQDPSGSYYNAGAGWNPIAASFTGTFDGNGHKIIGMKIQRNSDTSGCGLFKNITGGTVINLGLEDVIVQNVGSSTRDFAAFTGIATGDFYISNVYVTGQLKFGILEPGNGVSRGGALIARVQGTGLIENCWSAVTLAVSSSGDIGCFLGRGLNNTGQRIFKNYTNSPIIDSGSNVRLGHFNGWADGTYQDNYYNTEADSNTLSARNATGLTDAEIKDKSNFNNWNYNAIWTIDSSINDGYPIQRVFVEYGPLFRKQSLLSNIATKNVDAVRDIISKDSIITDDGKISNIDIIRKDVSTVPIGPAAENKVIIVNSNISVKMLDAVNKSINLTV